MTSETSKTQNTIMLMVSIFYIIAGIAQIGYFAVANAAPPHIPILGIVSLITAFTLFKKLKWTLPLAAGLFVTGITFAVATLSNSLALESFGDAMLFNIAIVAYMIILLIASGYVLTKRANFS